MKMSEMDRYLEDRGFTVKRNYISLKGCYEFTIRNGTFEHTEYFYYDDAATPGCRDMDQRRFLSDMITNFYELHPCVKPSTEICFNITNGIGYGSIKPQMSYEINLANTIDKVIFNDPATIILWKDGTKTVVKCSEDDTYDPEKGMAMAIAKKALGNKGNYCNVFKKWLPEEEECIDLPFMLRFINESLQRALYRVFGTTGEKCQQVVEEKVRVINDIEHLSGMNIECIRELLAAGYTLTPPEETKSLTDLIAEMGEDDGEV